MKDSLFAAWLSAMICMMILAAVVIVVILSPNKTVRLRSGCDVDPHDLKPGYYSEMRP